MSRSRRVLRMVARGAVTASLIATVAVVASVARPGSGRTIEALGSTIEGAGGEYHALPPQRVLDTRDPALDVSPAGRKSFATGNANAFFDVPIVGKGGLPEFVDGNQDCADDNVLAVAVNVTIVHPTSIGYLQAYGKGATPGDSSILNFKPNEVMANTAVLRPGCDGALSVRMYTPGLSADADVLIDVFGWFSSSNYTVRGARLEPAGPARIFDTRQAADGAAPLAAGQSRAITIRGAQGVVPTGTDVVGVLVNVTGVNSNSGSQPTFLSLLPAAPTGTVATSNLNLRAGQIRSNLAIVPLSADGKIWVYNANGNAHVVLDVMGYFVERPDNSRRGRVVPLVAPFRAFDTRMEEHDDAPLPPAYAEDWSFTDFVNDVKIDGEPVGNQLGVIGNLTGAELQRRFSWEPVASYLTAFPTPAGAGRTPPNISNVGIVEGDVVPNLALLTYGAAQQVSFYNFNGYLDYLFDASAVILAD